MKFQTNICPLCNKSLRLRQVAGVKVFECPTVMKNLPLNSHNSHYVVESDSLLEIQHMVVLPYSVDTYANSTGSRIYQLVDNKWKFVSATIFIHPAPENVLLGRIQKLL